MVWADAQPPSTQKMDGGGRNTGQRVLTIAALICAAWLAFLLLDGGRPPPPLRPAHPHHGWPTWEEAQAAAEAGGQPQLPPHGPSDGPQPIAFGALDPPPGRLPAPRQVDPPLIPGMPQFGQHAAQQVQQQQQVQQPSGGCDLHKKYDLSHLVQGPPQRGVGPIQDDEALLLYAVVRGMRMRTVVEIGGLSGYSAKNFLQAMAPLGGLMYTVDLLQVPPQHPTRHKCIQKDVFQLAPADLDNRHVDLVFFDAHVVEPQMHMYEVLEKAGMIDNDTVIALHDTNVHPSKIVWWSYELDKEGWVHQPAERILVERLRALGWEAWSLHPPLRVHAEPDDPLKFRHGITLMQRRPPLRVNSTAAAPGLAAALAANQAPQERAKAAGGGEAATAAAAAQPAAGQQQQQQQAQQAQQPPAGAAAAEQQAKAEAGQQQVVQALIADPSRFTTARFSKPGG